MSVIYMTKWIFDYSMYPIYRYVEDSYKNDKLLLMAILETVFLVYDELIVDTMDKVLA